MDLFSSQEVLSRWFRSRLRTLATVALAQTELGAITGTIEDTSGAAIPNCQVEMKSTQTSALRTATTDQNGFYLIPSLTVGSYIISASAAGFKRAVTNVVLTTSGTVANLQIPTGNLQQQVVVNAESGSVNLQTDSHELAASVTPAQLVNLPNSGRSIISIATLGPASQPSRLPDFLYQ
jgi:Carboxypeptidase regulatory-like domain